MSPSNETRFLSTSGHGLLGVGDHFNDVVSGTLAQEFREVIERFAREQQEQQETFAKEFAVIEVISTILFHPMWRVCYCMKKLPTPPPPPSYISLTHRLHET